MLPELYKKGDRVRIIAPNYQWIDHTGTVMADEADLMVHVMLDGAGGRNAYFGLCDVRRLSAVERLADVSADTE